MNPPLVIPVFLYALDMAYLLSILALLIATP
jgi:hypothetical protein